MKKLLMITSILLSFYNLNLYPQETGIIAPKSGEQEKLQPNPDSGLEYSIDSFSGTNKIVSTDLNLKQKGQLELKINRFYRTTDNSSIWLDRKANIGYGVGNLHFGQMKWITMSCNVHDDDTMGTPPPQLTLESNDGSKLLFVYDTFNPSNPDPEIYESIVTGELNGFWYDDIPTKYKNITYVSQNGHVLKILDTEGHKFQVTYPGGVTEIYEHQIGSVGYTLEDNAALNDFNSDPSFIFGNTSDHCVGINRTFDISNRKDQYGNEISFHYNVTYGGIFQYGGIPAAVEYHWQESHLNYIVDSYGRIITFEYIEPEVTRSMYQIEKIEVDGCEECLIQYFYEENLYSLKLQELGHPTGYEKYLTKIQIGKEEPIIWNFEYETDQNLATNYGMYLPNKITNNKTGKIVEFNYVIGNIPINRFNSQTTQGDLCYQEALLTNQEISRNQRSGDKIRNYEFLPDGVTKISNPSGNFTKEIKHYLWGKNVNYLAGLPQSITINNFGKITSDNYFYSPKGKVDSSNPEINNSSVTKLPYYAQLPYYHTSWDQLTITRPSTCDQNLSDLSETYDEVLYQPSLTGRTVYEYLPSAENPSMFKALITSYDNFDAYGNPTKITMGGDYSKTITLSYEYRPNIRLFNGLIKSSISNPGDTIKYEYDEQGRVKKKIINGLENSYSYSSTGELYGETDPNGNATIYRDYKYGISTNITKNHYDGISSTIIGSRSIDLQSNILSETDGDGNLYSYEYITNRLKSVEYPINNDGTKLVNNRVYNYSNCIVNKSDDKGLCIEVTQGKKVQRNYYDVDMNLILKIDELGNGEENFYTEEGVLNSKKIFTNGTYNKSGSSVTINYTPHEIVNYDLWGRVMTIINADGSTKDIAYDDYLGNKIYTNEEGISIFFNYLRTGTESNSRLNYIDEGINRTSYSYNTKNSVEQVNLFDGTIIYYSYNSNNRVATWSRTGFQYVKYGYDNNGNITSRCFGNVECISMTFDGNNQNKEVFDKNGILIYKSSYDNLGRLVNSNDIIENLFFSYEYDNINRVVSNSIAFGVSSNEPINLRQKNSKTNVPTNAFKIGYSYNTNHELTKINYPSGNSQEYNYDSLGRTSKVWKIFNGGQKSELIVQNIIYNDSNLIQSIDYAESKAADIFYGYDSNNRLNEVKASYSSGKSLFNESYEFYLDSNLKSITNNQFPEDIESFEYNYDESLSSASGFYGMLNYEYNSNGTRKEVVYNLKDDFKFSDNTELSKVFPGNNSDTLKYNYQNGLLVSIQNSIDEYQRSYDFSSVTGNLLLERRYEKDGSITTFERNYNALNKLTDVNITSSIELNNDHLHFIYDDKGREIGNQSNSENAYYLRGNNGEILLELDKNFSILKENYYLDKKRIVSHHYEDGNASASSYAKEYSYYDFKGNPKVDLLISKAGMKVPSKRIFDPFGNILYSSNSKLQSMDESEGFEGMSYSKKLNQYFFNARNYDPYIGSFVELEPKMGKPEDPKSYYNYTYSKNNPIFYEDLNGNDPELNNFHKTETYIYTEDSKYRDLYKLVNETSKKIDSGELEMTYGIIPIIPETTALEEGSTLVEGAEIVAAEAREAARQAAKVAEQEAKTLIETRITQAREAVARTREVIEETTIRIEETISNLNSGIF